MSIMLASTDSLQVVLDAAPATNQLPINASYVDQGGSGGNLPSVTTGVTAVTIVGSPAASTERLVSQISIPNVDTATRKVTVNLVRSAVAREICSFSLGPGSHLFYDGQWRVNDANGNFLCNVTVTGGTLTANQGTAAALSGAWPVEVTDGTNVLGTIAHPINTNAIQSGTWNVNASQSGTWTVSASASNFGINLAQLDGIALGAPSNYGTSPGTVAVQGVNAYITNTVPVSGTFWQATQPVSLSTLPAGTNALGSVTVSNFPATQPVSGTITANAGTGTFTVADTNFLAQASTTSGQKGLLAQGAVTTSAPVYTTAQTSPLSLTTAGALRVDGSSVTQPVSGSVSVSNLPGVQTVNLTQIASSTLTSPSNYGTAPTGTVQGVNAFVTNTPPVSQSGTWTVQPGNTANTTAWLVTGTGGVFPSSQSGAWTMTSNQGTSPWTIQGDSASGASNAGNPVKVGAVFNTTQPTVTTGQTVDAQATARGARIVATGVDTFNVTVNTALPVGSNTIGNVNAIQSGSWSVTNNQGAGNWNDNIAAWGGTSTSLGQKTSASSVPVVIASDQSSIAIYGTAISVAGANVTGTTVVTLFGAARTILKSLTICSIGPVLAAGTVTLTIQDNASNTISALSLPTATGTATSPFIMFDAQELNITPAGGMPLKMSLSSNLTSGSFFVSGAAF